MSLSKGVGMHQYDDYDEEDYLYYQYGQGPPPPLHYSVVWIDDVEPKGDPLTGDERIIFYEDYIKPKPKRTIGWPLEVPSSPQPSRGASNFAPFTIKPTLKNALLNPQDGSVVYTNDPITIRMYSNHKQEDAEAWVFFASYDLVVWQSPKKERPKQNEPNRKYSWQGFRTTLKTGARWGFIQFFQAAKYGAKSSKGVVPYGTIVTIFIYREDERYVNTKLYPPMVVLRPSARQTYVPLHAEQHLQLIVPGTFNVQMPKMTNYPAIKSGSRCLTAVGSQICCYFRCHYSPQQNQPIFFSAKDTNRQGAVIIPSLEKSQERSTSGVYAIVHTPLEGLEFHVNNVDGLIFRTSDPLFERFSSYLDKNCKLKIESKYQFTHADGHRAYDVRLRITDKNLYKMKFNNLFDPHACKIS